MITKVYTIMLVILAAVFMVVVQYNLYEHGVHYGLMIPISYKMCKSITKYEKFGPVISTQDLVESNKCDYDGIIYYK